MTLTMKNRRMPLLTFNQSSEMMNVNACYCSKKQLRELRKLPSLPSIAMRTRPTIKLRSRWTSSISHKSEPIAIATTKEEVKAEQTAVREKLKCMIMWQIYFGHVLMK
ncbi:hypothetical protein SORBI_3008G030501 [Sorghum bicolor]|uniref:Uncharacterized protein n=1 Tax=Sorghum bicolor TaxID=4558 RepID=A0A1Z5R4N5_SORBI|nr:hypothetical protein SORBI_3008G030501 [Sorghum bicolor]